MKKLIMKKLIMKKNINYMMNLAHLWDVLMDGLIIEMKLIANSQVIISVLWLSKDHLAKV